MEISELLKLEDDSVTDYDTIIIISKMSLDNKISKEISSKLIKKIKKEWEYVGLYPNTINPLNILQIENYEKNSF